LERKIRVGAVSYLNTKPLLYGIERPPFREEIELITGYPSKIADMLIRDQIDIGLVPVATIPELREFHLYTRFGIACDGPVASVLLLSEVPVAEIEIVMLDFQSRTSVLLVQMLFEKFWKKSPEFQDTAEGFLDEICHRTAAVVIGDRALEMRSSYPYVYDLGEAWKNMTGLPFVFAAWISNKKLDPSWVTRFDQANSEGLTQLSEVVKQNPGTSVDLNEYYSRYLNYELDGEKRKGLDLFLNMLAKRNQVLIPPVSG